MVARAALGIYTRLSRVGIDGVDRVTARFLMGTNHYLIFAIGTAVPITIALAVMQGGELWLSALIHAALVVAWAGCLVLNATGRHRTSAVLALLLPLVAYTAQTTLLSGSAGFLLPMLMTPAVSFVTLPPWLTAWRWLLSALAAAAVIWSYVDTSFARPHLPVSTASLRGLLITNVLLATLVIGSTSWLNDHYFTRERRRAESKLVIAQRQARTDPLTQVANRRGIVETIAGALGTGSFAVALVDLDRFKSINDRLGHAEGDRILAEVARILAETVGISGQVSRWGGEEFLVVLPQTRLTPAVAMLERARRAVEESASGNSDASVTVSIGIAAASPPVQWEVAIRVADALLYEAKEAGRNRTRYAQVRVDGAEWDT